MDPQTIIWAIFVAYCAYTAPLIDDPDADAFPETRRGVLSRAWARLINPIVKYAARQWGKL